MPAKLHRTCHSRWILFAPPHDKTNKMTVPSEDSDQPGYLPSLIRVFSSLCAQWVAKDPSFPHADSKDSDRTGRMPKLICLRWAHMPFCWFCHEAAHLAISQPP